MGKSTMLLDTCFESWQDVYNVLLGLYISSFEWENLPIEVNERFMEMSLMKHNKCVFFKDEDLALLGTDRKGFVALDGNILGGLDVYYEPKVLEMIGGGGYRATRNNHINCVVIWDNVLRVSPLERLSFYAKRIYHIERTIDVNVQAQKTPFTIACEDRSVLLSLKNWFEQYDDFKTVIIQDRTLDVENSIKVFNHETPFVADKLDELKRKLWNEALSFIGIENNFSEKKERLTADEVLVANGLAIARKQDRLKSRLVAVKEINKIFGLEVNVKPNTFMVTESDIDVSRETFAKMDGDIDG